MTKLFITGATGFIGGDALHAIVSAHPDYEITALVRNSDKGAKVASVYPKIRLVYGDLDSSELLEEEAGKADIVCNWASADHAAAASSLLRGLSSPSRTSPGFLIHTSGTGILCFADLESRAFGETISPTVYDDVSSIKTLTTELPDSAPHRNVDKIVQAGVSTGVRTAIVCPPAIVGLGRGPDGKRSVQLPGLSKVSLERGRAFSVGKGQTKWNWVHVEDLSNVYVKLVEEAAAGGATAEWSGKEAVWGPEGYFFAEAGELVWGDISAEIAKEGKKRGYFKDGEVDEVSGEEVERMHKAGTLLWGANSRCKASRAREVLKWKPERTLDGEVVRVLEDEYAASGLKTPHAAVAAGDA